LPRENLCQIGRRPDVREIGDGARDNRNEVFDSRGIDFSAWHLIR